MSARTSFANWPCSIARTLDVVGDAWTPLVLREAFYGCRRFDDFQESFASPGTRSPTGCDVWSRRGCWSGGSTRASRHATSTC